MLEYKNIVNSVGGKGITVEFENGSNMYIWVLRVDLEQFDMIPSLRNEFDAYANRYGRHKEIDFEIRFDSKYPSSPPFIRVIRPKFMLQFGHVTSGGSICMKDLTLSGWNSFRSIESIFLEILLDILQRSAKLDPYQPHEDYSLSDAEFAFISVARKFKWL